MNGFFKLLTLSLALSLLALPLAGCEPPWESGMTLNLKVDTPRDGTSVTTSAVTVNGRVSGSQSAEAKVSINGADVPVKEHRFSGDVMLTEGKNIIHIVAVSGQARLTEKVNVTYAPAKQ